MGFLILANFLLDKKLFSRPKNLTWSFLDFDLIVLKLLVERNNKPKFNFLFNLYKLIKFFSLNENIPYFFVFFINFIKFKRLCLVRSGFISSSKGYLLLDILNKSLSLGIGAFLLLLIFFRLE